MQINENLIKELKQACIPVNEGLTTVFILEYGLEDNNTIMNDRIISQLSMAGLVEYDFENEKYIVKFSALSDGKQKTDYVNRFPQSFLNEYNNIFKSVFRERSSDTREILRKLTKLCEERDATVTNEEILAAARLHVKRASANGPQFIQKADLFIHHRDKGFSIMPYIEEIRENGGQIETNSNPFNDVM